MAKYRIVKDRYSGYEVQHWRWWLPIWCQPQTNTHRTVEAAEEWAKHWASHKDVVKELGKL